MATISLFLWVYCLWMDNLVRSFSCSGKCGRVDLVVAISEMPSAKPFQSPFTNAIFVKWLLSLSVTEEDGTIWVFPSVLVHLSSYNKVAQTGELINKQKLFFFNSGAWKFKIKVPEMSPLSSHGLLLVFSQGRRHKGLSQSSFMRALTPFRRVPPSWSNQLHQLPTTFTSQ